MISLSFCFGNCETFREINEQLDFHLIFKTADLQDIVYTTVANDITLTFSSFFLFLRTEFHSW